MSSSFLEGRVTLWAGDCLTVLTGFEDSCFDSCVTDPPYHLISIVKRFGSPTAAAARTPGFANISAGFMGQQWDGGDIAFRPETWAEVLRVLKPGAHLVAFGAPKNAHRLACAIEDAGFEIRDTLMWLFATGFPKSHNVALGIDRLNGHGPRARAFNTTGRGDRADEFDTNGRAFLGPYEPRSDQAQEWAGWGTALKPAFEPIILARKPLGEASVPTNVLRWRTGALNIDGCKIGDAVRHMAFTSFAPCHGNRLGAAGTQEARRGTQGDDKEYVGRYPANLATDGGDETLARFFFSAKADADDRLGSSHPTVKPVELMQWLVRLVTPAGGLVLDPFAGTGTTGEAAWREGMRCHLIEREAQYLEDVRRRMALVLAGPDERARESLKASGRAKGHDDLPLFGGAS